jgi:WXG100 family type VII secretion target
MSHGGDVVHYNYAGIEATTSQLQVCQAHAVALQETGMSHRAQLSATWTGTANMSFDDAYNRFHQVNQNTIDGCQQTINAISHGNSHMASGEQMAAQGF